MFKRTVSSWVRRLKEGITPSMIFFIIIGSAICTFGVHNIHQQTHITEGGLIGTMLLIEHWMGLPPSVITPILDISGYLLAYKYLGGRFIKISAISTLCVSLFYEFWELFPPMLPDLSTYPLIAAILGGLFVGIGAGIVVRQGGSSGGDDALALTLSHVTHWRLSRAYLMIDLVVLGLSLSYIPLSSIVFSIVSVIVSSNTIDWVQHVKWKRRSRAEA